MGAGKLAGAGASGGAAKDMDVGSLAAALAFAVLRFR
jgi:hypothetical protein